MKYTLGLAAKATGKSKATLSRDIRNGKFSADKQPDGSYEIDAAELHRVYPMLEQANSATKQPMQQSETPYETGALQKEVDGLREQLALLKDERDDLRRRLDQSEEERRRKDQQLTALLTDQRQKEPSAPQPDRRSFWRWLSGQ